MSFDTFMILSTHLKEAGYTNLVLLENLHKNLTSLQTEYYNAVKQVCENSNIKYYVPPMNNYSRCEMDFDVIIGNPPFRMIRRMVLAQVQVIPHFTLICEKNHMNC